MKNKPRLGKTNRVTVHLQLSPEVVLLMLEKYKPLCDLSIWQVQHNLSSSIHGLTVAL